MSFYNALQLDPAVLKQKIVQSETPSDKCFYGAAIIARSILIVAFAILFISLLSSLFGQENTPLAVVLFCLLLSIRFVSFEYCVRDSLITLAIALSILLIVPSIVAAVPPLVVLPIHFISVLLLLFIAAQQPTLGNGGLFGFAYVYLIGNPVSGSSLVNRALMALTGYLICGIILLIKHRHKHPAVRFHHFLFQFDPDNPIYLWQLRMAMGISLILTAGVLFDVPRFMWMGFACSSILSEYPYSANTMPRFSQRILGAIAGSSLFLIVYQLIPTSLQTLLGPLGGLCLGFCTDYRYKTALNCFGALMIGTSLYGLEGAVILRIVDTIAGALFALVFAVFFHKLINWKRSFSNETAS